MTLQKLADELSDLLPKAIDKSYITNWENGKGCRDFVVKAYCKLFRCTPDYILGFSDDPKLSAIAFRMKQSEINEEERKAFRVERRKKLIDYIRCSCCSVGNTFTNVFPSGETPGALEVELFDEYYNECTAATDVCFGGQAVASERDIDIACDAVDRVIVSVFEALCTWKPKPVERISVEEAFGPISNESRTTTNQKGKQSDGKH